MLYDYIGVQKYYGLKLERLRGRSVALADFLPLHARVTQLVRNVGRYDYVDSTDYDRLEMLLSCYADYQDTVRDAADLEW